MPFEQDKYKLRGEKIKQIQSIREIIDLGQFQLAIKQIRQFLLTYGDDGEVLYIYGKLLRKTGQVREAIMVLKNLINFLHAENSTSYLDASYTELFKVYFINDFYQKAYDLLQTGKVKIENEKDPNRVSDISLFKHILEVRLGIYQEQLEEKTLIRKLLYYDREMSIKHVKQHLVQNSDKMHTVFNDIDVDDLFVRVERALPTATKIQKFSFYDVYVFSFSRIGKNDNDKLRVVINKGSYEIVSMYPINKNFKGVINDNLYDDYLTDQTPKVKKISQIEKFNNRYGRK